MVTNAVTSSQSQIPGCAHQFRVSRSRALETSPWHGTGGLSLSPSAALDRIPTRTLSLQGPRSGADFSASCGHLACRRRADRLAVPVSVPITASDQNQDILSVRASQHDQPVSAGQLDNHRLTVPSPARRPLSGLSSMMVRHSVQWSAASPTHLQRTVVSQSGAFELTRQGGGSFSLIVSPSAAGALTKVAA